MKCFTRRKARVFSTCAGIILVCGSPHTASAQSEMQGNANSILSPISKITVAKQIPDIGQLLIQQENSIDTVDVQSQTHNRRLELRLSERRVYVYTDNSIETSYPVAVGKIGWETPTGNFEVFSTVSEPGWTNPFTNEEIPPGPENPLGDRWIAFWTDGVELIGFHGTPNRESIGQAVSHGCVRMYNEHVRELFEMIELGTLVTVIP